MLPLERKSIEPMALALEGGNVQAMQQFIGQGAWSEDSARTVNRHQSKKNVKIETVLGYEDIRALVQQNDYVIPIGLASNEDDDQSEKNLKLAYARAHNLGLAIYKLGGQPIDRIWPNTLGYAIKEAKTDDEELKQRPVMLIGANARRPVVVPDVTFGAVKIAPQDRVIAEEYLFASDHPVRSRLLNPNSDYLEHTDVRLVDADDDYVPQVLPAVEQATPLDVKCDE